MDLSKDLIKKIMDNNYRVPSDVNIEELTPQLIQKHGDPDSDTREGALEILYTWIVTGKYDNSTLIQLGNQFTTLLQTNLGESGTDSTFLRAFIALELRAILKFDQQCQDGEIEGRTSFLTSEIVHNWLEKAMIYYRGEKDYRAYVIGKGWVHSQAHGADLFGTFVRHYLIEKKDIGNIFTLLLEKAFSSTPQLFSGKEEYRIAAAFYSGLLRDLHSDDEIKELIRSFMSQFDSKGWGSFFKTPFVLNGFLNGEHFLHALYFMTKFGISRKGSRTHPYYGRSLLQRKSLLTFLAEAIQSIDHGSFYAQSDFD